MGTCRHRHHSGGWCCRCHWGRVHSLSGPKHSAHLLHQLPYRAVLAAQSAEVQLVEGTVLLVGELATTHEGSQHLRTQITRRR